MPSLQVVDFGPDSFSDTMGKFAQGFSDSFFQQQSQKRNEDLFSRIKEKYGKDASLDRIMKDIIEAEGFDPEYKKDLVKDITEYAKLASSRGRSIYQDEMLDIKKQELDIKKAKADEGEKPITPFQKRDLELKEVRLANDQQRLQNAAKNNEARAPKLIADYINNIYKDADEKLYPEDKSFLIRRVQSNIKDDDMSVEDATDEAIDYLDLKNRIVNESDISSRPTSFGLFTSPSQQQIEKGMEAAFEELEALYEAGIESQKDLRTIAKRSGWNPEEITMMIQELFKRHGRKVRSTTKKVEEEQVEDQQEDELDNVLF